MDRHLSIKIIKVVKAVWLIATLLTLSLVLLLLLRWEDIFIGGLITSVSVVLLSGLILNFSPATDGTVWKNIGWGMFYGAILFVFLCLAAAAFVLFFWPIPMPRND